jgi:PAS domain S-box-containing protein
MVRPTSAFWTIRYDPDMAQPPESNPARSANLSPERLLAAIVDSSDDAVVSKDLNGVVTSWNKGAQRIFGYTAEEMVGQSIVRLMPPDRVNEEPAILARLRRGERVEHFETVRVRKDGRLIDVSLTISPVRDDSGQIVGASKIARDISGQKITQAKLADAHEALRRADRMKGEFISTLSHELRTPLNAINGWLQILEDGPTQEELSQGLDVIRRNVRAQSQLIDDLLDLSRIESGKLVLDIQRVDVPVLIHAALEAIAPSAANRNVRLTTAFSSVDGVVMGDSNRLQQIIWNLLTNAVKFSQKGGRVHVMTQRSDSHLAITVSDNGIGIAPEHLETIFERFNQADATTTRKYGGLGLGLSIAKHLVELHGGRITAKSDGLGLGSTFVVRLPLFAAQVDADEVMPSRAEPDHDLEELSGIKVLAVDDEPDSVDVIRRILERSGANVKTAVSMQEAIATFREFEPDVLISDIGMPEHDGYELITRIRAMPGGKKVAAVALTALARGEDRARALRAGFQMHVAKPVEGVELTAAVLTLAGLGR